MLPLQMRMARAALEWTVRDLADKSGLSHDTVVRMEAGQAVKAATMEKARAALEAAGVIFVEENGDGPGVRLRKHEAGRAHALEHAEAAADRHLADVDAPSEEKARRKRIVTQLAKDLATGPKERK